MLATAKTVGVQETKLPLTGSGDVERCSEAVKGLPGDFFSYAEAARRPPRNFFSSWEGVEGAPGDFFSCGEGGGEAPRDFSPSANVRRKPSDAEMRARGANRGAGGTGRWPPGVVGPAKALGFPIGPGSLARAGGLRGVGLTWRTNHDELRPMNDPSSSEKSADLTTQSAEEPVLEPSGEFAPEMSNTSPQVHFVGPFWWGYELHLNQPALDVIDTLQSVIMTVVSPFLPPPLDLFIAAYIIVRKFRIRRASRGQGVRLISPWTHPLILTPRPLGNTSPLVDTALRWSVFEGDQWSSPEMFPDHHSAATPALTPLRDQLVCLQRGGTHDRLNWMSYDPENGWSDVIDVGNQASERGPAVAVFNQQVHSVFRGGGDNFLWWSTFNGTRWTPNQQLPHNMSSAAGPAVATFQNRLFCVHRAAQDQRLFVTTFDGNQWSSGSELPHGMTSSTGPALAVFQNSLFCAHKAASNDRRLLLTRFNGSTWTPQTQIANGETNDPPALVVYDNHLYCMHRGLSNDVLWWSRFNGNSWIPWRQSGLRSAWVPGLVVYRDKNTPRDRRDQLMCVFPGTAGG